MARAKKAKKVASAEDLQRWLIYKLKRLSMYWPQKTVARNKQRSVGQVGFNKNGTPKMQVYYSCEICLQKFKPKEINLDHKVPVVDVSGFKDWNEFITRLFVDAEGYQVLCVECHLKKSAAENADRVVNRRNKKKKVV